MTKQKKPNRRPLWIGAAVVVAGLLLVQFVAPALFGTPAAFGPSNNGYSDQDTARVAMEGFDAASDLPDIAGPVIADVSSGLSGLEAQVTATADAHAAAALAEIDSAVASLAPIPGQAVADLNSQVAWATSTAFDVPDLATVPSLNLRPIPSWNEVQSTVVGPGGPPIGQLVGPAEDISSLDALGGDLLPSELDGLVPEDITDLVGGSPVEGLPLGDLGLDGALSQLDTVLAMAGASGGDPLILVWGTAQPDDGSAAGARDHATQLLGTAGTAFDVAADTGNDALGHVDGLVGDVEGILEATEQAAADIQADIAAQAEARVAAVTDAALSLEQDLTAQAAATVDTANGLATDASQTAIGLIGEQQAQVSSHIAQATAAIDQASVDIEALADEATSAIRFDAEAALSIMNDDAAMQHVIATALQAESEVRAAADAQLAALTAARADVVATGQDLQSHLTGIAAGVQADVQAQALAAAADAQALLQAEIADVQATATSLRESISTAALVTATDFAGEVEAHVDATLETAISHAEEALVIADGLEDLAFAVVGDAGEFLPEDLQIILQVAEDYGRVPTPERDERAQYWEDIHGHIATGWSIVDQVAVEVDGLSSELEASADGALSTLLALG